MFLAKEIIHASICRQYLTVIRIPIEKLAASGFSHDRKPALASLKCSNDVLSIWKSTFYLWQKSSQALVKRQMKFCMPCPGLCRLFQSFHRLIRVQRMSLFSYLAWFNKETGPGDFRVFWKFTENHSDRQSFWCIKWSFLNICFRLTVIRNQNSQNSNFYNI